MAAAKACLLTRLDQHRAPASRFMSALGLWGIVVGGLQAVRLLSWLINKALDLGVGQALRTALGQVGATALAIGMQRARLGQGLL